MRVLIGCEESGVVRDAFIRRGHDAYSNDIIETRSPGPHLLCDVFDAIDKGPWDIIILHPPCTALCCSGNSTYGQGMAKHHKRIEALEWTLHLWNKAKTEARVGVAAENPVGVLWSQLGVKPQYVHPWWFGHKETKATGLALHKLPRLVKTHDVYDEMMKLPYAKRAVVHHMPPSALRSRMRSETKLGLGDAMADQWGRL